MRGRHACARRVLAARERLCAALRGCRRTADAARADVPLPHNPPEKGSTPMSALDAALRQIDDVAADGDLAATPTVALAAIDPEDAAEPIKLPDGRTIFVPR